MKTKTTTIHWLMKGDPAIRWQTMRDLLKAQQSLYEKERFQIMIQGWGKKLLKLQDADGKWGGGIYNPKWSSTTYTMMLLRQLGLPPENNQAQKACKILLNKGYFRDHGINYFPTMNQSETCVTGMILSILSYFRYTDERVDRLAEYLLTQQMNDGGWNCQRYKGAHHSSLHSTISVLEGLRYYCLFYPKKKIIVKRSVDQAHEFILEHKLFKSDKTGKIIDPKMTRLSFPPQWRYDILRCLDYFQAIRAIPDQRMADAIERIWSKKRPDGTWPLQQRHPGKYFFDMEKIGHPTRWNTLRVLRVLNWWQEH